MCPFLGINVMIFILLFCLIDKRDENQLVKYILGFKAFQFMSGLYAATKLCLYFWGCLEATAQGS